MAMIISWYGQFSWHATYDCDSDWLLVFHCHVVYIENFLLKGLLFIATDGKGLFHDPKRGGSPVGFRYKNIHTLFATGLTMLIPKGEILRRKNQRLQHSLWKLSFWFSLSRRWDYFMIQKGKPCEQKPNALRHSLLFLCEKHLRKWTFDIFSHKKNRNFRFGFLRGERGIRTLFYNASALRLCAVTDFNRSLSKCDKEH